MKKETNTNKHRTGEAILSGKVDFKIRITTRDKGGPFILVKWLIYQEGIIITNLHMCNNIGSN